MKLKVLITLCFIMFVGCANINSGLIKDVSPADFEKLKSEKIIIKMGQVADIEIEDKKYTYTIDDRLQSYGFAKYSTPEENTICKAKPCKDQLTDIELYIDYSVKLYTSPKVLLFMVTLGLFPTNDEYEIKMNAVAVNREKKIIGQYHLEDTVKTHFQIFLLAVAPFLKTHTVSETIINMSSTLILQADADLHKNSSADSASLK